MKRLRLRLFDLLAAFSLALCVADIAAEYLALPDDDASLYWVWRGSLYSLDTFEDIYAPFFMNAYTLRRFDNWPSRVPLHFTHCSVEIGTEVPFVGENGATCGSMQSAPVWVDQDIQPLSHKDPAGHYMATSEIQIFQIPRFTCVVTAVLPVIWVIRALVTLGRRKARRAKE